MILPPGETRPATKTHTAASATMLLMASSLLSGLLALVRIKYTNYLFGAGVAQDAYRAAFALPDLLNYFLIGGAATISIITILNRYREAGDEEGFIRGLSSIALGSCCRARVPRVAFDPWTESQSTPASAVAGRASAECAFV